MAEEAIGSSFTPSTAGRTLLSPSITTSCASFTPDMVTSTSRSWSVPSESLPSRSSAPSSYTCIPSSPLSSSNPIPSPPGDSHSCSRSFAISSRCFFFRRAKSFKDIFTFGGGSGDCSRAGGVGSYAGGVDSSVAGVYSCIGSVGSHDGGGESESRRDGVDSHIDDTGGVGSCMTGDMDAYACGASSGGTILTSREAPLYTGPLSDCGTASTAEPAVLSSSNTGRGVCE